MQAKITKTYLGSTGTNYSYVDDEAGNRTVTTTETATFHVDFPMAFCNSTNRKYITVMSPKLIWGGKTSGSTYIRPSLPYVKTDTSKITDNTYIMHCSFIHTNPWHDKAVIGMNDSKRKYKKYEYKGCDDGFDITFTDYCPAFDVSGWTIGIEIDDSIKNDNTYYYSDLLAYLQTLFPDNATTIADQVIEYYGGSLDDVVSYRNGQRFKTNSKTEYITEKASLDWYDIVAYVIDKNGLTIPLEQTSEKTYSGIDGDYYVYTTTTSYKDYNINRHVSYSHYVQYKIFKDKTPWYYYAEFMVEY